MTIVNGYESFASIGVVDLLQADARPTFVVCVNDDDRPAIQNLRPVFSNNALNQCAELREKLFGNVVVTPTLDAFIRWIHGVARSPGSTHNYIDTEWCCTLAAGKWLVVGAVCASTSPQPPETIQLTRRFPKSSQRPSLDWTHTTEQIQPPEYLTFLKSRDWSSTRVGAMSTWPSELRLLFNMIMRTEVPQALYWGDDLTVIYNSGTHRSPIETGIVSNMVQPLSQSQEESILSCWDSLLVLDGPKQVNTDPCNIANDDQNWKYFEGIFQELRESETALETEQCVMVQRSAFVEEAYFYHSNIPITTKAGEVLGFLTTVRETTQIVLAERRLTTLTNICRQTSNSTKIDNLCHRFLDALDTNRRDLTFAAIYLQNLDHRTTMTPDSVEGHQNLSLKGSLGLLDGTLPHYIDPKSTTSPFSALLQIAHSSSEHILLKRTNEVLSGITSQSVLAEYGQGAGFEQAVLYPLRNLRGHQFFGFLLIGLSTRCLFDDVYEEFVTSVGERLNNALTTISLRQLELREHRERAELHRIASEKLLTQQIQQAKNMELRFTRLTTASPSAVCIVQVDGTITYANDMFHTFFGSGENSFLASSWMSKIYPEDLAATDHIWQNVAVNGQIVNYEYRIKKKWSHPTLKDVSLPYTWLMANVYPTISENGVAEYVSTVTDITLHKWLQQESQTRTEEVLEAKRQQDAFTDMVAHEIRNPLNAILQSADMIQKSMEEWQDKHGRLELTDETIENSQTVIHCALHQKKIIDDLLVLSKLDSDLLSFVPVLTQPTAILKQTERIFRSDASAHQIVLSSEVDSSLAQDGTDRVLADPHRISQVLVNLITNAIKFTKSCAQKFVKLRLEAAHDINSFKSHGFKFFPTNRARPHVEVLPDDTFLLFSVTDGGPGISPEAESELFQRFSQESVRTHVVYGGSGLGLWISRELTEMQGGEIGFRANPEGGTTFAFYIRAKSASPQSSLATEERVVHAVSKTSAIPTEPTKSGLDFKLLTVLLTEDNLINQRVMKKQLSKIFGEVLIANHGAEAINILKQSCLWKNVPEAIRHSPDLILMDIEMPVLNGVDCTRKIREFEAQGDVIRRIPIVAVSANARIEQIAEYREAGMDDVLAKPFVVRDLVALISRLLE